jgi:hypothetical protein
MLNSYAKDTPLPYYTPQPLSKETTWIAIPIYLHSIDSSFNEALTQTTTLLKKIEEITNIPKEDSFSNFLVDFDTTVETLTQKGISLEQEIFQKLASHIQFHENHTTMSKNNYSIEHSTHLILQLQGENFWQKMHYIGEILDRLYRFEARYKKEKSSVVIVGGRGS